MSKAFCKDSDETEDDLPDADAALPAGTPNYMTPSGLEALRAELNQLNRVERPKVVEIVSWAAGNGDRSENGDYLYGKKRLREIDRRLRFLTKRIESAKVVDPADQQGLDRVFFGATVTYINPRDEERTVTLVGIDEADMDQNKISWRSPVARALFKAEVGDTVVLRTPAGTETLEILSIRYGSAE